MGLDSWRFCRVMSSVAGDEGGRGDREPERDLPRAGGGLRMQRQGSSLSGGRAQRSGSSPKSPMQQHLCMGKSRLESLSLLALPLPSEEVEALDLCLIVRMAFLALRTGDEADRLRMSCQREALSVVRVSSPVCDSCSTSESGRISSAGVGETAREEGALPPTDRDRGTLRHSKLLVLPTLLLEELWVRCLNSCGPLMRLGGTWSKRSRSATRHVQPALG